MKDKEVVRVEGVDRVTKAKALFVLKCKGSNLSEAIRQMIDSLAEEYEEMNK